MKTSTQADTSVKTILLVEDSPTTAEMYAAFLENAGYQVEKAGTGKQAIEAVEGKEYSLLLLDLALPDMDGIQILNKLQSSGHNLPTIVITGNGSVQRAVEAMRLGAMDFMMKPCSAEKLGKSINAALARRQASKKNPSDSIDAAPEQSLRGPSGFLGYSPIMQNVFALIERAAQSNASVFITGESGTGKELCAQAIHDSSPRRNDAFVAINCAAIPRDLMESEIFGHRKGAFTGAQSDYEGAASMADGGTLFLDELCEMQMDLQAKLLRFIQTGVYKRLGDSKERNTDLRFLCATNRDPLSEVQEGRFREDLYYRLHVVPIHMPPLRDRDNDIDMLANRFLKDFSVIEGKKFKRFDQPVANVITRFGWPGNVRQLENAIRQIVVLNDGENVTLDMLPAALQSANRSSSEIVAEPTFSAIEADSSAIKDLLIRPLDELDMMAIEAAIEKYDGNISRAARALDISTSTIYRKRQAWEQHHGKFVLPFD